MQGITVDGQFPRTKKEVKEVVAKAPHRVGVIATSLFGGEYNGRLDRMPHDKKAHCAGPDYQANRRWCVEIRWVAGKLVAI